MDAGQDSFLDVVSNIVGILIILVVIVGAQVKSGLATQKIRELQREEERNAADFAPNSATDLATEIIEVVEPEPEEDYTKDILEANERLEENLRVELGLKEEILELERETARLNLEQKLFQDETIALSTQMELVQREMDTFTNEQDIQKREALRLTQELGDETRSREALEAQLAVVNERIGRSGGAKMIEHKTTPIIRSVESRESLFIVDDGRVMYIPFDELLALLQNRVGQTQSLIQSGSYTEVVGPYDDFRLHMVASLEGGRVAIRWRLLPPSIRERGETLERALALDSAFHHQLSKLDPKKDIITLWIYPDGFGILPKLKAEAYRLGFSVALRPLPAGTPIAGAPEGQRSVAQ